VTGLASFRRLNRPVAPTTRTLLNVVLFGLALVLPFVWVVENFRVYDEPGNLVDPFTDASTYLAAGERLNAGHKLYELQPGDRYVLTIPGVYSSPLLSPPPIAVIWRPLAASGIGLAVWVVAAWACLTGTLLFLLRRLGPWAALPIIILSPAIGEQLAVANANAFAPAIYLLAWKYQRDARAGVAIATHAVVKLAPVVLIGWLAGAGRWRAAIAACAAIGVWIVIGGIGAGFGSYGEYLGSIGAVHATSWSIAGLFGPISTYLFLGGGFAVSIVLGVRGRARGSFLVAVAVSVLGTPALYLSGLVGLLGVLAPWALSPAIDSGRVEGLGSRFRWRRMVNTTGSLPG
jgi:glycosyl transferase family 87